MFPAQSFSKSSSVQCILTEPYSSSAGLRIWIIYHTPDNHTRSSLISTQNTLWVHTNTQGQFYLKLQNRSTRSRNLENRPKRKSCEQETLVLSLQCSSDFLYHGAECSTMHSTSPEFSHFPLFFIFFNLEVSGRVKEETFHQSPFTPVDIWCGQISVRGAASIWRTVTPHLSASQSSPKSPIQVLLQVLLS